MTTFRSRDDLETAVRRYTERFEPDLRRKLKELEQLLVRASKEWDEITAAAAVLEDKHDVYNAEASVAECALPEPDDLLEELTQVIDALKDAPKDVKAVLDQWEDADGDEEE